LKPVAQVYKAEFQIWKLHSTVNTCLQQLTWRGCYKSNRMISIVYIELTTWFRLGPQLSDSRQYILQYRHGNLLSHPHEIQPLKHQPPVTVCLIATTIIKCVRLSLAIKSTLVLLCVDVTLASWSSLCNSGICHTNLILMRPYNKGEIMYETQLESFFPYILGRAGTVEHILLCHVYTIWNFSLWA
jgi:hypothetical protein